MPMTDASLCDDVARLAATAGVSNGPFEVTRSASVTVLADREHLVLARVSMRKSATADVARSYKAALAISAEGAPVLGPIPGGIHRLEDERVVTFWPLAETPTSRPTAAQMAGIAVRLHGTPKPPGMPRWDLSNRLFRKHGEIAAGHVAGAPKDCLSRLRTGLARCQEMASSLADFSDGVIVHDDFHPSNVVQVGDNLLLCDLDTLCEGPREADLAKMVFHCRRFLGTTGNEFLDAYPFKFDLDLCVPCRQSARCRPVSGSHLCGALAPIRGPSWCAASRAWMIPPRDGPLSDRSNGAS